MIVLGIDPGTAKMGWGIVKKQQIKGKNKKKRSRGSKVSIKHIGHGMIKTPSDDSKGKRLASLKQEVGQLLREYQVDEVAAEKVFFNINKKSAINVSQALGTVHLVAAELNVPIYEYNALEAKLLIAGHGRADKKFVQDQMKKRLRLKKHPTPIHAADALAIACCHILKSNET